MIFTPTRPLPHAISFALFICFLMAKRLQPAWSFSKPSSSYPICAVDIIPIPPSAATAPASFERLMPTPIPPCMIGIFATMSPIRRAFNFSPHSYISILILISARVYFAYQFCLIIKLIQVYTYNVFLSMFSCIFFYFM